MLFLRIQKKDKTNVRLVTIFLQQLSIRLKAKPTSSSSSSSSTRQCNSQKNEQPSVLFFRKAAKDMRVFSSFFTFFLLELCSRPLRMLSTTLLLRGRSVPPGGCGFVLWYAVHAPFLLYYTRLPGYEL